MTACLLNGLLLGALKWFYEMVPAPMSGLLYCTFLGFTVTAASGSRPERLPHYLASMGTGFAWALGYIGMEKILFLASIPAIAARAIAFGIVSFLIEAANKRLTPGTPAGVITLQFAVIIGIFSQKCQHMGFVLCALFIGVLCALVSAYIYRYAEKRETEKIKTEKIKTEKIEKEELTMENKADKKFVRPSLGYALVTLCALIVFFMLALLVFKVPVIVALFFSWMLLTPFAMKLGYSVADVEETVYDMIKSSASMFSLLLAIGCMVSIWLCAGTVPTLIYWGLNLITPRMFFCLAFLFCAVLAIPTGTSWGTMSTAGIAMMGVGLGLGLNPAMVVGAIVSGSYVGDAISPASDTPLLTASACNVPLMQHLKHNLPMLVPTVGITAVLYAILGFVSVDNAMDKATISAISSDLAASMKIGILTLIPMIVVVVLLCLKQSALSAILSGCLVGMIVAVAYQGYSISEVGNFMASGFVITTGNEYLDPILNRGGVSSMLELLSIIIASLGMGGILKGTQILDVIVESSSKVIRGRIGLTTAATAGCVLCLAVVSTNYFSIILNSTLFTPLYKKMGYRAENASRVVNNVSCVLAPFVPWGLAGVYVAATFGIDVVSIIPYSFFNILLVVMCLVYGYLGISMTKEDTAES